MKTCHSIVGLFEIASLVLGVRTARGAESTPAGTTPGTTLSAPAAAAAPAPSRAQLTCDYDPFITNCYALETNRPSAIVANAFNGNVPWSMTPTPNLPGANPGVYVDFCGGSQGLYAQSLQSQGVNAVVVEYATWAGSGPQPEWYINADLYSPGAAPLPPGSASAGSCVWGAAYYGTPAQQVTAFQNMAATLQPGAPLTVGPFSSLQEAYTVASGTTLRPFATVSMEGGNIGVIYVNGFQGQPFTAANVSVLAGAGAVSTTLAYEVGGPGWAAASSGLSGGASGYYYTGTYAGAGGGFLTGAAGFAGSYYGAQGAVYVVQQAGVTNPTLISVAGNVGGVTGGAVASGATATALYSIGVPIAGVATGAGAATVFLTVTGVGLAAGATAAAGYALGSAAAQYTTVPLAEVASDWFYAEQYAAAAQPIVAGMTCACQRSSCKSAYLGLSSSCTSLNSTANMPTGGQLSCNAQNGQRYYQSDGSWIQYDNCLLAKAVPPGRMATQ